jgi:hypothetical protein
MCIVLPTNLSDEALAEEWQRLCNWFHVKADAAIAATDDDASKELVRAQVEGVCHETPPTEAMLSAWRMLFNDIVASWETERVIDDLVHKSSHTSNLHRFKQRPDWRQAA